MIHPSATGTALEHDGARGVIQCNGEKFCCVCCGMQSHKYTRGKRKRSNHLLVSLSAIAEDKMKAIKTQFRNCT